MDILSINQIKNKLTGYKTKTGKWNSLKIKNDKKFVESIKTHTNFLSLNATFSERLYCIQNNITYQPVCDITGKQLRWNANKHCYSKSKVQGYRDRKQNFSWVKDKIDNIITTLTDKFKTNNYKLLTKDECIKLGKKYINRRSITPYALKENLNLWCSILNYTKFLNTSITNWSERLYLIQNNIDQLVIAKDGFPSKFISFNKGYSVYSSRNNYVNYIFDNIVKTIQQQNFTVLSTTKQQNKFLDIKCNKCNTEKQQLIICGLYKNITCNKCTGYGINRSKYEDEIKQFILTYVQTDIKLNFKTEIGEIDLYLPEYNIGIEFHGILWHSFGINYPDNSGLETKLRYKSANKYEWCKKNNIHLLTVFESDWVLKQDIIKSMILSKLKLITNNIYARKCIIGEVNSSDKRNFIINNHIQGQCQSCYNVGLYYDNELVALMSFSKRKLGKNNKNNIELVRYACKTYTNVVGGFSKLLKYAEKELNDNIVCYCDKRYSLGNVYFNNGFKLQKESNPNYYWTKDCILLESRNKYQKHKLINFDHYDNQLTESEIMYLNGYRKIYDCGHYVFIRTL